MLFTRLNCLLFVFIFFSEGAFSEIPSLATPINTSCNQLQVEKNIKEIFEISGRFFRNRDAHVARVKYLRKTIKKCSKISIPILSNTILNKKFEAKSASIELGVIGKDALIPLRNLLRNSDYSIKKDALRALGLIGEGAKPIIKDIKKSFYSRDEGVKFKAAIVIFSIRQEFFGSLYPLLMNKKNRSEDDIITILNYMKKLDANDYKTLNVLAKYIQYYRPYSINRGLRVRQIVLHTINKLGIRIETIVNLILKSHDSSINFQKNTASAIELIGGESVDILIMNVKNGNQLIKKKSIYLLGVLYSKGVKESDIYRVLVSVERVSSYNTDIKRIARYFLAMKKNTAIAIIENKKCESAMGNGGYKYDAYTDKCILDQSGTPMNLYDFSLVICEVFGGCKGK